jgi:hypothetical protein
MSQFASRLDVAIAKAVHQALADEAAKRGVSVDQLSASGPFDKTEATRFEPEAPGTGGFRTGERYAAVEIPSDAFGHGR